MASPLIGIAGVNSLLFAAYGTSKRLISSSSSSSLTPGTELSLGQTAAAGAMAGAVNAVLASPGGYLPFHFNSFTFSTLAPHPASSPSCLYVPFTTLSPFIFYHRMQSE
ncbi:hypothetical protein NMY22_g20317 [Coprinellus aureogranulatus]|nr:hypothetical protein NMY22_g20317 [Coprinellus aureogranulatus]